MKHKIREWLRRYGPSEIIGTVAALVAATATMLVTQNSIAAAFAGTWGENAGYYGSMLYSESRKDHHKHKAAGTNYGLKGFSKTLHGIAIEFGPAEILDSFAVRPFCMFLFPKIISNFQFGIFAGKLAADIVFYIPTIAIYEIKKKHLIKPNL